MPRRAKSRFRHHDDWIIGACFLAVVVLYVSGAIVLIMKSWMEG